MKEFIQYTGAYLKKLDKGIIFSVLLCSGLSIVLLYSLYTNHILDDVDAGDYITQLLASAIGLVTLLILSAIDYKKIIKLWFIYAPIALILSLLVFTPLGYRRAGADDQAWLNFGAFSIQPSEILKLAFILTFSLHLSKDEENMNHPLHMILLIIHGLIPIGIVAIQGDYGTAIVFSMIFLTMMIFAKISWKYVLAGLIAIPAVSILLWNFVLGSTHKKRILVLLHPGTDPEGLEYQQDLGLVSLASGKIFGKGLFNKDNNYVTVPEMHNDFIFAYIGQVFGFVGSVAVILVLTFLCLKILFDGIRSEDRQGMFLCIGVFAMLFTHCFMNIGMVLKVMPVIGVPLPFISAGGTAMLSMYISIGFVLSTYSHRKNPNLFYTKKDIIKKGLK